MAVFNLQAEDIPTPPERVGENHIIVKIGQTIPITQAMLVNLSKPKYYQEDGLPIASVKINGHGLNSDNILKPTGTSNIATLTNNGNIIRYNTSYSDINNSEVTKANFTTNKLTVTGNSIGSDLVTFTCTASSTTPLTYPESEYSNDTGIINIKVVPAINNPPTIVGDNTITYLIGTPYIFKSNDFTYGTTPSFVDPDGDKPLSIKITTLPVQGVLLIQGIPVVIGDIITVNEVDSGFLQWQDLGQTTNGQLSPFQFEVSDEGTGIFKA